MMQDAERNFILIYACPPDKRFSAAVISDNTADKKNNPLNPVSHDGIVCKNL